MDSKHTNTMKITSIFAILMLATSGFGHANRVLFEEDFESFPDDADVMEHQDAKNEWRTSGYAKQSSKGQALIVSDLGGRSSKAALTTPLNADGNESESIMNLTASFNNTEEDTRISISVFPEAGSGQIMLRTAQGEPSRGLAKIYFKAYPSMQILAMAGGDSTGSSEQTPIQLGNFKFGKWYRLEITLHPEKQSYDVEVFDLTTETSLGSVEGLDFSDPLYAFGNILVGAIYGEKSRYAWDDIKVEMLE